MTTATSPDMLAELRWRGLLYQTTEGLEAALAAGTVSGYCGFDPTAPSLHVGNLVPVMGLVHLQRAGHRPVVLVGGGTGLIGDPSGKTQERQLNTPQVVEENTRAIAEQLGRFLEFDGATGALLRDNAEWLRSLRAIDFMRDVGKHFRVNAMMQKESVRARLESETGISYTEFSYMLLQAYDFVELRRRDDVSLQLGGSDQWGNITAGVDLVRRLLGQEAHGLTMPLVTTAAGTKFGKTEAGAVWLDAARTSPYQFYQFWVNADDRDTPKYLRYFTLMPREEIEGREAEMAAHPERREAQRALAREVTERVHGAEAARVAEEMSLLLFGKGDPSTLSSAAIDALAREIPFKEIRWDQVVAGRVESAGSTIDHLSVPALEKHFDKLIVAAGLATSNKNARQLMSQGGFYVNGRRVTGQDVDYNVAYLPGRHLLLRKGARDYALVRLIV